MGAPRHLATMPAEAGLEATLYPNQPGRRAGFIGLMLGMSSVSLIIAAGFALAGAWPVAGFLGIDLLLLYLAFRLARTRLGAASTSASTRTASWYGGSSRTGSPASGA